MLAPETVKTLDGQPKLRWTIAGALFCLGLAGMRSSFVQHRDSDAKQTNLNTNMSSLQKTDGELKKQIETFGPKLDAIINSPDSPEQKLLATSLRDQLKPTLQVDEPFSDGMVPGLAMLADTTNIGGSVAKGVVDTSNAIIAVQGKSSETALFSYLYDHENDPDIKPHDMNPGYGSRTRISILSRPSITTTAFRQMKTNEVVYVGVLITFSDEQGRKYHSEKCMYFDNVKEHLDHFCDGHNVSY